MSDERSRGPFRTAGSTVTREESTRLLLLVTIGTLALTLLTAEPATRGSGADGLELHLWPPVVLVLALVVAAWGIRGTRILAGRVATSLAGRGSGGPESVGGDAEPDPAGSILVSRVGDVSRLIRVADIDWVESSGRYAAIHACGRRHLLGRSLSSIETALDDDFVRVHRSTLVRVDRVANVRRLQGRDFELELRDGTTLRLSRTYREGLERRLGIRL